MRATFFLFYKIFLCIKIEKSFFDVDNEKVIDNNN